MYWVSGGMEGVYCVSFDGDWERGETWHKMCHRHMSVLSTVHDNWHNNKKNLWKGRLLLFGRIQLLSSYKHRRRHQCHTQEKRTHYIILSNTAYIYKNWCFSFTVHNIPWSRDPKCQLQIVETRNGQTASKEGLVYVYVYFSYYKCIFNLAWS